MNKTIIVIGDAFVDRYHLGTSTRLSPEAPIPVVGIDYTFDIPGGAANVRANLISLGENGKMLFPSLSKPQNYPIKNRLLSSNIQIARWDEKDYCFPFQREDLLPLLEADAIIVSDYGKGSVSKEVIQILRDYRGPLFVDTKKDPTDWIGSNAILFPNLKEYNEFQSSYEWFPQVVLKQGSEGLALVEFGKVVLHRPAMARFVTSVNGAGDTVIAAFVSSFLSGANLDYCLEFANAAAAISVEGEFTTTPQLSQVTERFGQAHCTMN